MPSNSISSPAAIFSSRSYTEFTDRLRSSGCSACPALCNTRTNIVVDRGNPSAKVVAIGEAPGEAEDRLGKSFVGRSGRLLDRVMADLGLDTNRDMLILNVVKCRPPENRPPSRLEAANCRPYLDWQLNAVRPDVVILLGATAAKYFLPPSDKMGMRARVGRFFNVDAYPHTKFFLLYHPAYILRNPRQYPAMVELARPVADFIKNSSPEAVPV